MSQTQPPVPQGGRSVAEIIGLVAIGASVAAGMCCIAFYLYISRMYETMQEQGLKKTVLDTATKVMDPWKLEPLTKLGSSPVNSSATDVESFNSQRALLESSKETCDRKGLTEMLEAAKGTFLNFETHLKNATAITDQQEMEIGACLWNAQRGSLEKKSKGVIMDEGPEVDYIRGVIEPLLKHSARPGITYTVHYSTSPEWNACAMPGGQIVVNKGFLDACENEAEVAGVLSHEIQHVEKRHTIARLTYAMTMANILRGNEPPEKICQMLSDPGTSLMGIGTMMGSMFYNSAQETEADLTGIEIMVRSGYSPFAVARLWRKKADESHDGEPRRPRNNSVGGFIGDVLGNVLKTGQNIIRSHPESRLRFCMSVKASYTFLEGEPDRNYYVGRRNLKERIPFSKQQF